MLAWASRSEVAVNPAGRKHFSRFAWPVVALAWLCACETPVAPARPDAVQPLDSTTEVSLADVPIADAPTADASPPADVESVLPSDAPTDTNLIVHVTGEPNTVGTLRVLVVPSTQDDGGSFTDDDKNELDERIVTSWPQVIYGRVPAGSWAVAAMVTPPQGGMPSVGLACSGGLPAAVVIGPGAPAIQQLEIQIRPSSGGQGGQLGGVAQFCSVAGSGPAQLLTEQAFVEMDGTANGKAHYLRGVTWADQLWIADSQDGVVRFDFPSGPAPALQGWKVIGGDGCVGIARLGARVFCAARTGQLRVVTQDPGTPPQLDTLLSDVDGFEGVAIQAGLVWVAAHGKGLRAFQPTPPYSAVALTQPGLKDAWDVRALGDTRLVVADGANGVVVLDVTAPKVPKLLGSLALPGLSAYVQVHDLEVAVGAPGGGLHFVDVANPAQPKLRATVSLPDDVHGLAWQTGLWIAAAGHHTYALELLGNGPVVRMVLPVRHFAMDIVPFGEDWLLALDFQSVRKVKVTPSAPATTLVVPPVVQVPVAKAGDTLAIVLLLRNPGPQTVAVTGMTFAEAPGVQVALPGGPWTVPAGGKLDVPLLLPKTVKGTQAHRILLAGAGPAPLEVRVDEVTTLQPGNLLPPLQFQDALGQPVDVQKTLAGKPGVVLIAAQSCPAAFLAMATAAIDLGPRIAQGKVAVVGLNPWDKPDRPEVALLKLPYPVLYTGLTTSDTHAWSEMVDGALGQTSGYGPPMPIVYVVDAGGKIVLAQWGYESATVLGALDKL
jgi:hypothetical protein